jgi:hypothetical protein
MPVAAPPMVEVRLCAFLPDQSPAGRQRTLALVSMLVGSMILARGIDSRSLSDELRQAALAMTFDLGAQNSPRLALAASD